MADDDDEKDFEEIYGAWEPSLYAAAQIDGHRFALLIGGPRYDDPYTIILTYDSRLDQPWSRFDVRREIQALLVAQEFRSDVDYLALSRSGDLYAIGKDLAWSTIPGTPTDDPNSEIILSGFALNGSEYVVGGDEGFLKAGRDRSWRDVAPPVDDSYPYASATWRVVGKDHQSNLYVAAYRKADPRHFNFYPGHHPEYQDGMSEDEIFAKMKMLRAEQRSYPQRLSLFVGGPERWKEIKLPDRISHTDVFDASYIARVVPQSSDVVQIMGSHGLILTGSSEHGFREISSIVDREYHLREATIFADQLVVSTGDQLFRFDGHRLRPLEPKLKVNKPPYYPQAAALHARGDKLFLFDFTGVIRIFDGSVWATMEIPPELLARPFQGLLPLKA